MKYSFLDVLRYQTSDTEYETPKGYHHPDAYYDDDEQPLYHDSRRSPKRRLLPATPQGESCIACWKGLNVKFWSDKI